jgi:hypothetical protein
MHKGIQRSEGNSSNLNDSLIKLVRWEAKKNNKSRSPLNPFDEWCSFIVLQLFFEQKKKSTIKRKSIFLFILLCVFAFDFWTKQMMIRSRYNKISKESQGEITSNK